MDHTKPPLYAGFLAAVSVGFGEGVVPARIAQSLAAGAASILIFFIGTRLFSHTAGLIASAIFALHPVQIYLTTLLYPQSLFTLFVCGSVLLALQTMPSLSALRGFVLGVATGAGTLCVEILLVLLPTVALWILLRKNGDRGGLKALFLVNMLLGATCAMAPWAYRNYRMTGNLFPHTAFVFGTFWETHSRGTTVKMMTFGATDEYGAEHKREWHTVTRKAEALSPSDATAFYLREAWKNMRKEPLRLVYLTAGKFAYFFWPYPEPVTNSRFNTPKHRAISAALCLPLLILAIYGALAAWRRVPDSRLLVFLILLYAFGYSLFHVNFRYRLPLDPLIWVLSAYGLGHCVSWWRGRSGTKALPLLVRQWRRRGGTDR